MDRDRFLQLLQIVLHPEQGDVKDATGALQRDFYTKPEALLFLIEVAISYNDSNLKQLAAVQARSLVSKHWNEVPADQKPHIREQLLRATLNDNTSLIRHAYARIISAIARLELADGEWTDLPGVLAQGATSSNKDERAISVYILYALLDTVGENMDEKYMDLLNLFERTIRDPDSAEVRINTLQALGKLSQYLLEGESEQAVKAFQNIFPAMVSVLKDAIDEADEERVMQAFEVFQVFLEVEPQLINMHLKDLILFMNQVAGNTEIAEDTRTQALSFLLQSVRYRKLKLQALQVGPTLIQTALQILTELEDDSAEGEDDITPARSAQGLVDMLSQSLSPSQAVIPLLNSLGSYFNHQEASHRRAGIIALGMCVEGAPDFISTQLKDIFPVVLRMLEDPVPKVRQSTLHSVARLADDLGDQISQHYSPLMPLLVKNLAEALQHNNGEETGPSADIIKASVSAIDAVVDGMDEKDVVPYQSELVPALQQLFRHPNFKIKALSAGALGSTASSAGEAFGPYFDETMHLMQECVTIKEGEDALDLRASVTDAMGEMASSAGPTNFGKYVEPLMRATEEALHLDHPKLKESTYIFWGNMSNVYGTEFKPFLEGAVKGLFACLEQVEDETNVSLTEAAHDLVGREVTIGGKKVRVADADDDDDDDDDGIEDLEDLDDDDDWQDLTTVTPLSQEKEIAVEVIGNIISQTKEAYLPYFEKTVEHLLPLVDDQYEGVRKATISSLHRAYATLWQVCEESGQMEKWLPGKPMTQPPSEIKKFGELLMTATLKLWMSESDPSTVTDVNRNVAENLKFCGPYLISNKATLDEVVTIVETIVTKQHICQMDLAEEEDEVPDIQELSEYDWVVIDTALDVVAGLAIALGADFVPIWSHFEKIVLQHVGGSEALERATAVGVLAEVIRGMREAVTPFTSKFLQILMRRLSDESMQTRSNATYAVGRLVEWSTSDQEITNAYPSMLEKLETCLHISDAQLPDNAVGCVSRMILKHKDHVPIAEVLPVVVGVLPLSNDYEENEPLYRMICQLYKWEDQTVRDQTSRLVPIFQSVLTGSSEQLEGEVRTELIELVSWLNKMQPGGPASWIEQLGQ